jgi:hypothetical protein
MLSNFSYCMTSRFLEKGKQMRPGKYPDIKFTRVLIKATTPSPPALP